MRRNSLISGIFLGLSSLLLWAGVPSWTPSAQGAELDGFLRRAMEEAEPGEIFPLVITPIESGRPLRLIGLERGKRLVAANRELRATASRDQEGILLWLSDHGYPGRTLWAANRVAASLPAKLVVEVAKRSDVRLISLDRTLSAEILLGNDAGAPEQPAAEWHLNMIHAPALWRLGHRGEGVVIAVMDSGADLDHPQLSEQYRGGPFSWYDPHGQQPEPHDLDGHGTQALGLAVGGDDSGVGIGAAPDATWIAVRVFDDDGETSLSSLHLAFQWLLDPDGDPDTADAPHIVTGSWGFRDQVGSCVEEFIPDVNALTAAGIAVVFAAGNEGPGSETSLSPANYPGVISVGAVDQELSLAPASSRGPSACDGTSVFPSLTAPGVSIKTTDLTFGGVFPNSFTYVSGTSFAAPLVAGSLALLIGARPEASIEEVIGAFIEGAEDLGAEGPDPDFGNGLVLADSAYDLLIGPGECLIIGGDGAPCDDHDPCSDGDSCLAGSCIGPISLCDEDQPEEAPEVVEDPGEDLSFQADSEDTSLPGDDTLEDQLVSSSPPPAGCNAGLAASPGNVLVFSLLGLFLLLLRRLRSL